MISPISFTGTYKVTNKDNFSHEYLQFRSYAVDISDKEGVKIGCNDAVESSYPYRYTSNTIVVAPDKMDKNIETFCRTHGIKYTKAETQKLMQPVAIEKRIKKAPRGMELVRVNVDALEEIIQEQNTNLNHCEKMYNQYFKNDVDFMLKNGAPIQPSSLYITPANGRVSDTVDYIEHFGADELNKKQLFIDFNQATDQPDQCTYFALRDLGMDNVPVYVNQDTLAIGNALGIFE